MECQLRTKGFFGFRTFWTKFCNILKYGNNLKLEIINYIIRKIITLNEVNILESPNEYYQKQVLKNSPKKTPLSSFVGIENILTTDKIKNEI